MILDSIGRKEEHVLSKKRIEPSSKVSEDVIEIISSKKGQQFNEENIDEGLHGDNILLLDYDSENQEAKKFNQIDEKLREIIGTELSDIQRKHLGMIVFKIQRKLNELEVFISTEDILDTMINIIDNQLSPDYKSILEKKVVHDHLRIILKDISKATIDNHLDKNNYLYNGIYEKTYFSNLIKEKIKLEINIAHIIVFLLIENIDNIYNLELIDNQKYDLLEKTIESIYKNYIVGGDKLNYSFENIRNFTKNYLKNKGIDNESNISYTEIFVLGAANLTEEIYESQNPINITIINSISCFDIKKIDKMISILGSLENNIYLLKYESLLSELFKDKIEENKLNPDEILIFKSYIITYILGIREYFIFLNKKIKYKQSDIDNLVQITLRKNSKKLFFTIMENIRIETNNEKNENSSDMSIK